MGPRGIGGAGPEEGRLTRVGPGAGRGGGAAVQLLKSPCDSE